MYLHSVVKYYEKLWKSFLCYLTQLIEPRYEGNVEAPWELHGADAKAALWQYP